MREISKEEFKKSIIENVKNQYRRTIDEATPQQIFQAVSYAIKDVIIDDWIATQKQFDETGAKKVYWLLSPTSSRHDKLPRRVSVLPHRNGNLSG